MHIPKTGGTAVLKALEGISESYLGPIYFDPAMIAGVRVAKLPESGQAQFATRSFLRSVCRDSRLVMGHYGAQALIEAGFAHVATQLREPRARLLSLYRYWQSVTDDERNGWGPWGDRTLGTATLPLEEFLGSSAAWPATDNAMARQLLVRATPQNARHARRLMDQALQGRGYEQLCKHLVIAE